MPLVFFLFLFLSTACATTLPAESFHKKQPLVNEYSRIMYMMDMGREEKALHLLRQFEKNLNRRPMDGQDYLLGSLYFKLGNYPKASRLFRKIITDNRLSDKDAALWHLVLISEKNGHTQQAQNYLSQLAEEFPESRFYLGVLGKKASFYLEKRNLSEALSMYRKLLVKNPDMNDKRVIRLQIAKIQIQQGHHAAAAEILKALYLSSDRPAEAAAIRDVWQQLHIDIWRDFSVDELVKMAEDFNGRRMGVEALEILKKINTSRLANDDHMKLHRVQADIYFGKRDYSRAAAQYRLLFDHDQRNRFVYRLKLATSLARSGEIEKAISLNRDIVRLVGKDSQAAASAQYKIAFLLMDSGQLKKAVKEYEKWLTMISSREEKNRAYWAMGWCSYRLRLYGNAADYFTQIEGSRQKNDYWESRSRYWAARALGMAGKDHQSAALLKELLQKKNSTPYYRVLATYRLQKKSPAYFIKHNGSLSGADNPPWIFQRDGVAFKDGQIHHGVMDLAEGIQIVAGEWGVDPRLIVSQIWQESSFQSDAISVAHAMGLMQILPSTAQYLAKSLGWKEFEVEDLMTPSTNIVLGISYMRNLLKRYNDNAAYALAAYNAGEEAVDRWLQQRTTGEVEEFIEEIPYSETNKYVKIILARYWNMQGGPKPLPL